MRLVIRTRSCERPSIELTVKYPARYGGAEPCRHRNAKQQSLNCTRDGIIIKPVQPRTDIAGSDVDKDLGFKAKDLGFRANAMAKDLSFKAKDLSFKAKDLTRSSP